MTTISNAKSKPMFYCGICGTIYGENEELAAKCCTCDECGKTVEKHQGHFTRRHKECEDIRRNRQEDLRLQKAEKLEDWGGPVVWGYDTYFQDLDELVDFLDEDFHPEEPWPEWVYICDELPFPKIDLDDILENLCEDHGIEDFNSLDIMVPDVVMWHENPHKVVRIPPREAK